MGVQNKPSNRKQFSSEFKREAVRLVRLLPMEIAARFTKISGAIMQLTKLSDWDFLKAGCRNAIMMRRSFFWSAGVQVLKLCKRR